MFNILDYMYNKLNGREVIILPYRIKETRKMKGFTQKELSEKAGVSRTIISKLENDEEIVTSTDTLKKIAEALNVNVSTIFLD